MLPTIGQSRARLGPNPAEIIPLSPEAGPNLAESRQKSNSPKLVEFGSAWPKVQPMLAKCSSKHRPESIGSSPKCAHKTEHFSDVPEAVGRERERSQKLLLERWSYVRAHRTAAPPGGESEGRDQTTERSYRTAPSRGWPGRRVGAWHAWQTMQIDRAAERSVAADGARDVAGRMPGLGGGDRASRRRCMPRRLGNGPDALHRPRQCLHPPPRWPQPVHHRAAIARKGRGVPSGRDVFIGTDTRPDT